MQWVYPWPRALDERLIREYEASRRREVGAYVRLRVRLWEEQDGRCALCRLPVPLSESTVDHILPSARGGTWALENLQMAHSECNGIKGSAIAPAQCLVCRARVDGAEAAHTHPELVLHPERG